MEATTRKLIRPAVAPAGKDRPPMDRKPPPAGAGGPPRKSGPAESTNAENFYYSKQIQQKTPMVIVLRDNEELRGVIEWYDKTCIKLELGAGGVAMVYKASIKYMYKDE